MKRFFTLGLMLALVSCGGAGKSVPDGGVAAMSRQSKSSVRSAAGNDSHFVVTGRYINLDGTKFFVKGMVYAPTPIGKTPGDPPGLDDPLRDANKAVWQRDLPKLRAMGVNAIHVYNVVPPPYDTHTGPISDFLKAAWNGGDKPIFVVMSVFFLGDKLFNKDAVNALAQQYHDLDAKYAKSPAVMGVAISNEIGADNFIKDAVWWNAFNKIAEAAKKGFADGGNPDRIVTTSEADGNIGALRFGEKFGAKVDVWGINIYRGRTFTNLFKQIRENTTKPVFFTEYGATAARHPLLKNTYSWEKGPTGLGSCAPARQDGEIIPSDVEELPGSGNPNIAGLVDYVTSNAKLLHDGFKEDGVVSGGFYFEWLDEWWKGLGKPSEHFGNVAFNGAYPSCNEDSGWYGLNSVAKGSGDVDILKPRKTLTALKDTWISQP
ncbi:MAG: hypothetical protein WAL67_01580 [Candidatus Cybelea sp.]